MKIQMKIDWLTLTGKSTWGEWGASQPSLMGATLLANHLLDLITQGDAEVKVIPPSPHYNYGFLDVHSGLRVSVSSRLKEQGWMLTASGTTLNTPIRQNRLVQLASAHGWNCSRLDFAVDILNSVYTVGQFYADWKKAHENNRQKTVSLIEGQSGSTVYLGSRTSERMVRFYDKGAEQNVPFSWLRMEMEFKGEAAARALDAAQYRIANLIAPLAQFVDVAGVPLLDAVWLSAPDDAAGGYWPLKVAPPRERWFNTDVLSALRKWAVEDIDAVMDWTLRAHDEAVLAAEEARRRAYEEPIL